MIEKSKHFGAGSRFGHIRSQAKAVWRGPQGIDANLEHQPFWGWPILSLEVRPGPFDQVESRVIYANTNDAEQRVAILRAVYWDGQTVKRAVYNGAEPELILPARFVVISMEQVLQWLTRLEDITVRVNDLKIISDTDDIKRLRIEQDYISSIFEFVWQGESPNHELLNQKWNGIWIEMTNALRLPPLENFEEHFRIVEPEFKYDMNSYIPERHVIPDG